MSPKRRRRLAQKAMRNSALLRKPVRGGTVDDGSVAASQANALIAGALSQFLHSQRRSKSRPRAKSRGQRR